MSSPRFWYGLALGVGIAWWLGRRGPSSLGVGGASGPANKGGKKDQWSGLGRFR